MADTRTCRRCEKVGHIARDCPAMQSEGEGGRGGGRGRIFTRGGGRGRGGINRAEMTCYNCIQLGHLARCEVSVGRRTVQR